MLSLCDLLEIPPSQSASCTVWLGVDKNEHDVSFGCFLPDARSSAASSGLA